ncbi:GTP-binding protein [Allosaccharopolyspora coralli]|uniref:GTP-binding protein n=1 Tax=Allosaccharopolyspora coralli TaxID=2665642 RepID=A0A5Q3Q7A5_9PSEU|nr:GTP-binding protein [Allosaccharopolyspora coralli]QGK70498.1 GTP-binding protein [Allosaccharopolyspora coralli]
MARTRIPVIVVAGFLGSGKTTLLNHLLRQSGGTRIGVIVNDFGSINIDAMAVAGQVDAMVSLDNGCLCCAVDPGELDTMVHKLSRPQSAIDVIVIEASGLADPRSIVKMLISSEEPGIRYGGFVEVVDAVEFDSTRSRHPEIDTQIDFADVVLVNKIDRVDADSRASVLRTLGTITPGTPLLPTEHGRIDPSFLFDEHARSTQPKVGEQLSLDDLCAHDEDDHEHLHTVYETVTFTSESPMDPRSLMHFLDHRPAGLYRLKGNVYFGLADHPEKFVLHTVGNYLRFHRRGWDSGETRTTSLVAIGAGLDTTDLTARLRDCVAPESSEHDEFSMLPILRFTDG